PAKWTDRIITLTERGTEEHLARGIGRPEQYVTVPSGVPTEPLRASAPPRAEARARLGLDPGAFVVMGLGRLIRIKGFDLAVRALPRVSAAMPSPRRLIAPDDPEALAAALVELGRDAGLRRKLGEAGRQRAEAFSTAVADEKLLALYRALAREKGLG